MDTSGIDSDRARLNCHALERQRSKCPPGEILFAALAGRLGETPMRDVLHHLQGCMECRAKARAIRRLHEELGLESRAALLQASASRAAKVDRGCHSFFLADHWQNGRRFDYDCGDPDRPRMHLVAARRMTFATVGDAPSHSRAEYEVTLQGLDWSGHTEPTPTPIEAEDSEELIEILRTACNPQGRPISVFLTEESVWLVESLLRDEDRHPNRWQIFVAGTTDLERIRQPLTILEDESTGINFYRIDVVFKESVLMCRWLWDKQGMPAGNSGATSLAAIGRVLELNRAMPLTPPGDPILVIAPADDQVVDEDELFTRGHRELVATP